MSASSYLCAIARLEALPGSAINDAKKVLADEATTMLHGAQAARAAAEKAFEKGAISDDLSTVEVPRAELEAGVPLANLAVRAGLAASNGEAKRLAQGGGLRLNDAQEADVTRAVTLSDVADGVIKLAAARRRSCW